MSADDDIPTHQVETPITANNLPSGTFWEEDGACWTAIKCEPSIVGCDWRWVPNNQKAFAKGEPQGPMTDYAPPNFV